MIQHQDPRYVGPRDDIPRVTIPLVLINGQGVNEGGVIGLSGGFTTITARVQNWSGAGAFRVVLYRSDGSVVESSTQAWLTAGGAFDFPVNTNIANAGGYFLQAQTLIQGVWAGLSSVNFSIVLAQAQRFACYGDTCQANPTGPYSEPTCGGTCGPRYACVDGICLQQTGGPYREPTCGGQNCARPTPTSAPTPLTGLGQQSDKKVDVITIPSWAWIVGGVGVAAVAIFAILGMQRRDAF